MIPLRMCPQCQRWFAPANRSEWLCGNCTDSAMSKTILFWFAAFAGTVIAILAWHFFK